MPVRMTITHISVQRDVEIEAKSPTIKSRRRSTIQAPAPAPVSESTPVVTPVAADKEESA